MKRSRKAREREIMTGLWNGSFCRENVREPVSFQASTAQDCRMSNWRVPFHFCVCLFFSSPSSLSPCSFLPSGRHLTNSNRSIENEIAAEIERLARKYTRREERERKWEKNWRYALRMQRGFDATQRSTNLRKKINGRLDFTGIVHIILMKSQAEFL